MYSKEDRMSQDVREHPYLLGFCYLKNGMAYSFCIRKLKCTKCLGLEVGRETAGLYSFSFSPLGLLGHVAAILAGLSFYSNLPVCPCFC